MSRPGASRPSELRDSANRASVDIHRSGGCCRVQGITGQGAGTSALLFVIDVYRRLVSPLLPPSCRFQPSCSQYAREALKRHGVWRGTRLAAARLLRCHPFYPGGWDPVP